MGKESSVKDKDKSNKDVANPLSDAGHVNDMVKNVLQMTNIDDGNVEKKNDKKNKKRKLEVDLMDKFQEDGKKKKRAKHDVEGREISKGKDERKDRKKEKKYNVEATEVEEVPNDTDMIGVEKAREDNGTLDDVEVKDVGCEEKNKKKKDKRTKDDTKGTEIGTEKDKGKGRKKKDKYGAEVVEFQDVSNDENMVGVEKARKDKNTSDCTGDRNVGCEEKNKKKKDRKNKKGKNDVEPSGVQEASGDTHVEKTEKAGKKGKRTKSDTEGHEVSEALNYEQNNRMKTIDLKTSDTEEEMDRKKKRKKKKKMIDDSSVGLPESKADDTPVDATPGAEDNNILEAGSHRKSDRNGEVDGGDVGDKNKGKKKKTKSVKKASDGKVQRTDLSKKETPKRVSFSDQVEVFPSSDGPTNEENGYEDDPSDVENSDKDGLVQGKRFSKEEDEMIKKAVFDYIEQHNLGEEGVDMILHCKAHKELRNCWKDIAAALPWRPYLSIYYRAHILFERDENRKWTADDYELVRTFHEKHGSDWKTLADAIGKHRFHVKDTWRRIKLTNRKKGQWSQDEYKNLFDLVNTDLRMKATEEKKSKHGMLRDNIAWGAISDKLSTRTYTLCCSKWYSQLTSSMVAEGVWADTDDFRLVDALQNLDACSMEDVDWDDLLEHRSGELCRKRWKQMVNHLGHLGTKSFAEQVDVLSERYCLDVLEAREAYNSNPAVDS